MAFLPPFFLGNIGQENVFYDIVERKNAFLGYKNNKFKKSKNWFFPKGLAHGFGKKSQNFFVFLFQWNRQRNNVKLWPREKQSRLEE